MERQWAWARGEQSWESVYVDSTQEAIIVWRAPCNEWQAVPFEKRQGPRPQPCRCRSRIYPCCHIYIAVEPGSGSNHKSCTHPRSQQKVSLSSQTWGIYTAVPRATELQVFKARREQCLGYLSLQGHNHLTKITWKECCSLLELCVYPGALAGLGNGLALPFLPPLHRDHQICCGEELARERKEKLGRQKGGVETGAAAVSEHLRSPSRPQPRCALARDLPILLGWGQMLPMPCPRLAAGLHCSTALLMGVLRDTAGRKRCIEAKLATPVLLEGPACGGVFITK